MLIPLKQFYCDTCNKIIDKPEEGYVEWIEEKDSSKENKRIFCKGFRIIHNKPFSPFSEKGCSTYIQNRIISNSLSLDRMLKKGLSKLLSFLDSGQMRDNQIISEIKEDEMRSFLSFFARLSIPYFEEARKHFNEAESYGLPLDAAHIYDPEELEKIIEKYSK